MYKCFDLVDDLTTPEEKAFVHFLHKCLFLGDKCTLDFHDESGGEINCVLPVFCNF